MFTTQFILSIGAATIAGYAVGALWYSPFLFLKPWRKALGKTDVDLESNKKEMPRIMVYGFLNTIATAFALGIILEIIGVRTLVEYLYVALFVCFSFIVTTKFNDLIYESREPHWSKEPQILFLISIGYYIALFLAMALAFWSLRI